MAEEEKDSYTSPRGDLFHQGVVIKLFPSNNTGVVRTESGRELLFSYELVLISGAAKSPLDLKVGDVVGYDVGWTSGGLRITKLKTYPRAGESEAPGLQGQRSEGKDLPS